MSLLYTAGTSNTYSRIPSIVSIIISVMMINWELTGITYMDGIGLPIRHCATLARKDRLKESAV